MSDPCLTPREWARVRAYDEATEEQCRRDEEYAERPLQKSTALADLLNALEAEAMEIIKDANLEIGVLVKCKETFKARSFTDRADHFIRLLRYQIEEEMENVTRWRSYQKEAC
jgi:hypothetical protein